MTTPSEYVAFVRQEYLADFVRAGGSSVKFVVPDASVPWALISESLRAASDREQFLFTRVDSAVVKVHMVDKVFNAIARQVDWNRLAQVIVRDALDQLRFIVPDDDETPTLDSIASANRYDAHELRRDFKRQLQEVVLHDYAMAQEFRIAMMTLCVAQVDRSAHAQASATASLEWLAGDLQRIVALKPSLIFQKIGRHNARHMLCSLAKWCVKAGHAGLVIDWDLRQLAISRRADVPAESLHYSKPAMMDAYEVLRQLIDGTDEMSHCLTVVTCAPEFLSDASRGVDVYSALKNRIWDDVHDARRPNPLSALVRLSGATSGGYA